MQKFKTNEGPQATFFDMCIYVSKELIRSVEYLAHVAPISNVR